MLNYIKLGLKKILILNTLGGQSNKSLTSHMTMVNNNLSVRVFDSTGTLDGRATKRLTASRLKRLARGVLLAIGIALCSASPAGQATTMQQKTPFAYSSSMIGETQTECLFRIAIKESNIRYNAINRSSGAYGAWQFLSKSVRGKTPHEQVLLAIDYANYRYGSPCKAWEFWQRNYWW